jgi:hypothetical protein
MAALLINRAGELIHRPPAVAFPSTVGKLREIWAAASGSMAGGRPTQGKYPELEELASWFHRALADAGYRSVHEFLGRGWTAGLSEATRKKCGTWAGC